MKISPKQKTALLSALLLTGVASANMGNKSSNNNELVQHPTHNFAYTAHGKTDRRTAMLFKQLLKNNHNLEVHANINQNTSQQKNNRFSYTITGRTSMANVKKLMKLFKSKKHIEIIAQANPKSKQATVYAQQPRFQPQWNSAPTLYLPYSYTGQAPAFIQGNMIWYPLIPVNRVALPLHKVAKAPFPMDYADLLVSK